MPIAQISDAADTLLQPKLAQIAGVGKVTVEGGLRPAVRVRIDPTRLAAYGLVDGGRAQRRLAANVDGAKGGFDGARQAVSLGANDQLVVGRCLPGPRHRLAQRRAGAAVATWASVISGVENDRVGAWYFSRRHGAAGRGAARHPAPAGRQHRADGGVRSSGRCPRCKRRFLPASAARRHRPHRDDPRLGADVQFTLLLSVALVMLVIFLFLRSLRATLIPAWRCRCR